MYACFPAESGGYERWSTDDTGGREEVCLCRIAWQGSAAGSDRIRLRAVSGIRRDGGEDPVAPLGIDKKGGIYEYITHSIDEGGQCVL